MLARGAFQDDDVVELSKQFVCILVDIYQDQRAALAFRIEATPTVSLIPHGGDSERRLLGPVPPRVLLEEMHKVLNASPPQEVSDPKAATTK